MTIQGRIVIDGDRKTNPSDPRAAVFSKGHLPCRLERLEVLVRLKKGGDAQRIQEPECDQEKEDVARSVGGELLTDVMVKLGVAGALDFVAAEIACFRWR